MGGRVYGRVIWYPPTSRQNSNILRDNAFDIKIVDNTRRYGSLRGYAGLILAPAKGFGLWPKAKTSIFYAVFGPFQAIFSAQ